MMWAMKGLKGMSKGMGKGKGKGKENMVWQPMFQKKGMGKGA